MNRLIKRGLLAAVLMCASVVAHAQAAGFSNYATNKIADNVFRSIAFTPPTTLCVALATAAPNNASTGATIAEASYTGYARAALNAGASNWKGTGNETSGPSAGTSGTVKNNASLTFGTPNLSVQQVVTHVVVIDSCTIGAGNMIMYVPIANPQTINIGAPAPVIATDALTLIIDN